MKSLDKLPTPENLDEVAQNDVLERNKFIANFIRLLASIEGHYSIAIDGRWGSGKTFFVKQTERVIKAYHDNQANQKLRNIKIFKNLFTLDEIISHPMITFYYDAWQHDNKQDSLLSLVFELVKKFPSDNPQLRIEPTKWDNIQKTIIPIAQGVINHLTGIDFEKFNYDANEIFKEIQKQDNLENLLKDLFENLLPDNSTRLVIFIDELDRCRPDYAVQLLERIKHYMNYNRITFVFSVNIEQLQHTIKRYYGDGFEASMYLDKFFDLHVKLPFADLSKRREAFYFDVNKDSVFNKWCQTLVEEFKFEIREIIHFQKLIKQTIYTYDDYFDKYRSNPSRFQDGIYGTLAFLNYFFAPLALVFFIKNINLYYDFIDGKNENLIDKLNEHIEIFPLDFLVDIFKVDTTKDPQEQIKEIQNDFHEFYITLFETNDHRFGGVMYRNIVIEDSIKHLFVNQISLLSLTKNY